MKKYAAIIILVLSCVLFTACGGNSADNVFEFSVVSPKTEVACGETVVYKAVLKNNTQDNHTLSHGMPLISIYTHLPGERPAEGIGTVYMETELKGEGVIEQEHTVQFAEAGEYILRAFCVFGIGETEYRFEAEDITITVTE